MFSRLCPSCGKTILYNRYNSHYTASKNNKNCKTCALNDPERRAKHSARMKGENNPFFGQRHSEQSKAKISDALTGKPLTNKRKRQMSRVFSGKKNPMYGKTIYQIWVEKYGEDEAKQKLIIWKANKLKTAKRGKENHNYGKTPPKGTGNGWKGWYKGNYFRSLREVTFMIYLNDSGVKWKSGECKEFSIPYVDAQGTERFYKPDFVVNNKTVIEIKPKKLQELPQVIIKTNAALDFCFKNGFEYQIIDVIIDAEKIKENLENGHLKFSKKYKQKFLNYFRKMKLLKGV